MVAQHYFEALFYGVACTAPMLVPVPLCRNDNPQLWDYGVWVSDLNQSSVLSRDFWYHDGGCRMHCILLYCDQDTAPSSSENQLLSSSARTWLGNILVVWANNEWPPGLVPDIRQILDVVFLGGR